MDINTQSWIATTDWEGHDFSCLENCLSQNAFSSAEALCNELLTVGYNFCNSFHIGTGRCVNSPCLTACNSTDWCYFGSGTLYSCPSNQWKKLSNQALTVYSTCINSRAQTERSNPTSLPTTMPTMFPTTNSSLIEKDASVSFLTPEDWLQLGKSLFPY